MAYLLDTHVILWILNEDAQLSRRVRNIISDEAIPCYVSIISFFEMSIKKKIGKLRLDEPVSTYLEEVEQIGIHILPLSGKYLDKYHEIALHDDHRDPFDKLIIATALSENFTIISNDEKFEYYKSLVNVVW